MQLFENSEDKRARAFIEIFEKIYLYYQEKLKDENRVDFEDMLLKGKGYIENQKIKYLIVDEFQDISPLRAEVLKKIKSLNKKAQLFVVGDDWQAIYAFSGGDISIIVDTFEKYFGTKQRKDLALTYRFNQRLCEFTSFFILENSKQLNKKIKGIGKFDDVPVEISCQKSQSNFEVDFSTKRDLLEKLHYIFKTDSDVREILFLSRYHDYVYKNGYEDLKKYIFSIFKSKRKNIKFSTIHAAKGSEADYVFIFNITDGFLGFPSGIEDDPLLKLAKYDTEKNNDQNDKEEKNEEERRLFYVALTRTKKKVFVYGTNDAYFIKNIEDNKNIKKNHHYSISDITRINDPKTVIVINFVKGNKKKVDKKTPAKNIGLEVGDFIIKVQDKNKPSKRDFDIELKKSKGKKIKIEIKKTTGEIQSKVITPFDSNDENNIKKRWEIGATYFDREIDPFVEKLIKENNIKEIEDASETKKYS